MMLPRLHVVTQVGHFAHHYYPPPACVVAAAKFPIETEVVHCYTYVNGPLAATPRVEPCSCGRTAFLVWLPWMAG